jgi:nicotinamide-nucleotide amidase
LSTQNCNAEIITIGDEILIGQIIDTNSAWIAQQLNLIGINVVQISSISDNKNHIINALKEATVRADLILVTGGLGPTRDDITKQTIAGFFNSNLKRNDQILNHITKLLNARNVIMNELNVRQADLPDNCIIIPNDFGTAQGMWFEKEGKVFVFMPGVPYEMKGIVSEQLLPRLVKQFSTPSIYHKTLMLQGIAESKLAEMIESWELKLPDQLKLAYLPSPGLIRLRLTAKGEQMERLKSLVHSEVKKVFPIIEPYYFGEDDEQLEMIVSKLLKENNLTLSTAESCTGGKIAHLITSVPGSSSFFKGSVVAYANEIKTEILKVSARIINDKGAVSEEVVREMAQNVRVTFGTDYSIAVSGIAGPDGGTPEKPVGTTWIAIASPNQVIARMFVFGDNRERNIQRASVTALNELRKAILADVKKS